MRRRAGWRRWGRRCVLALAAAVLLAVGAVAIATGTAWGRGRLLGLLLDVARDELAGRVEVGALRRLSPFGVALEQVRLFDPASQEVLQLDQISAELAPIELLSGRIVAPSLRLGPGRIDLRQLGSSERGLLAALRARAPSPAQQPSNAAPPYVRVDELRVQGLNVVAPELSPPLRALSVRQIDLAARLELEGTPEVTLQALTCQLWRDDDAALRLSHATGLLARPGGTSRLELRLDLEPRFGAGRLDVRASGVLPDGAGTVVPIDLALTLGGVHAADAAGLLQNAAVSRAFQGALDLDLHVTGNSDDLSARGTLSSAGGALTLSGGLRQRHLARLRASAAELRLGALRPELPVAPLAFSLEAGADLAERERLPLSLAWRDARLGSTALPDLAATGEWTGRGVRGLALELTRGPSHLTVTGDAGSDGLFDVELHADVRRDELGDLARVAGLERSPASSFEAELRLGRAAGDIWQAAGRARAARLMWPGLAVSAARADVELAGPLLALRGSADLVVDGVASSGVAVRAARLRLDATPSGYRLRGSGHTERQSASLDVRAQREAEAMLVSGQATARFDTLPIALQIERTRVGFDGSLATRGIALDAGGQSLRLSGSYAGAQLQLAARASGIDLATLAAPLGLESGWRGRADLQLEASGQPTAPRVDARLHVHDLAREGAPSFGATLALGLDVARRRASVDAAIRGEQRRPAQDGSGGSSGPWIDGALSLAAVVPSGEGWWEQWRTASQRVAIELRSLDLDQVGGWLGRPLPVSGQLSLSGALQGSVERPALEATLRGRLAAFGLGPLGLEQRFSYAAGQLGASTAIDDASGRWLDLRAGLDLDPGIADDLGRLGEHARELAMNSRWSVSLDAQQRMLGSLWTAAPAAARQLAARAALELEHTPGSEPSGQLALNVEQTASAASVAGCATTDVQLALIAKLQDGALEGSLQAQHAGKELLGGSVRAPVSLASALRGGAVRFGSMSGELVSRALELQTLPLVCERARGRVDARARVEDLLGASPLLDLDVRAAGLSLGADPSLNLALRGRADQDDVALNVEIDAGHGHGSLSAALPISWQAGRLSVAADAPLQARARLDGLPIAPLLDPAGALSYASGKLSGKVDVAGTLRAPEPSGHIELSDAELTATALAQPLHGVQGRFSFDRRSLVIEHFEARDRDGSLQIAGKARREDVPGSLSVQLTANAKSFPLRQRGQIVATTSGRAEVAASVTPERSVVQVELSDVDTWLEKFQARSGIDLRAHPDYVTLNAEGREPSVQAADDPQAERLSVVRLDASDRFWIKREDFAIQLSTRLEARIEGDEARLKGRVEINRGYLDLMGRVFNVERGSFLEFIGSTTPDPTVSITAKYESKSAGKTVTVRITGRGSKPELTFMIDNTEGSARDALGVLIGLRGSGSESSAKQDASSFVQGLTAGLLATSARRELGAAAPIIMIEPGEQTGDGRIRAGFELDSLVPAFLRSLITGVYVEGIVEREGSTNAQGQSQQATTQAGVLVELYFPHQLFTTGQWGPGTTWALDWGWQL